MRWTRLWLGVGALSVGCGAAVSLNHPDASVPVDDASASGGTTGNTSGSTGSTSGSTGSTSGSTGSSGSTSGSTGSSGGNDAGPVDANRPDVNSRCSLPVVTVETLDSGQCSSRLEKSCGAINYSVFCLCPQAKCTCVKNGSQGATPTYFGCDDKCTTGIQEAYLVCNYP